MPFISQRFIKQRRLSCLSLLLLLLLLREAGEISTHSPFTDSRDLFRFLAEEKFSVAVKHISRCWEKEIWEESEELRSWEHIRACGLFLSCLLFLSFSSFLSLLDKNVLFQHL